MRLLSWIYVNLKPLVKQFPLTVLYMIGLPLFIGLLMGNIMNLMFESPNNIEPLAVQIIDEDQSSLSKQLITFLSDESLATYVQLSDENFTATLTIPKGYEQQVQSQVASELLITEEGLKNNHALPLTTFKQLLDQYHEQLMIGLSQNSSEPLSLIYHQQSLITEYVDTPLQLNSYTYYSVSMMGFFIVMMILTITASGYKSAELGLHKRMAAMPLTRVTMLHYDFIANCIYCFLLLFIYVIIYRILGHSFTGSFWILMILIVATSLFIVSIGLFIQNFFSSKYGYLVSYLLFFAQIVLGGAFVPSENLQFLSPSQTIVKMFNNYILFGTWESIQFPLIITVGIGVTLYVLTCLKEKYQWWEV